MRGVFRVNPFFTPYMQASKAQKRERLCFLLNFFERSNPNIKHLLIAIVLSMVIIGCDSRYGGPIFPVPPILDERPAVPSDAQVLDDLEDAVGQITGASVKSEVISVDSRIYIVLVEKDSDLPVLYKVTYYLLDGEWVCVPELIEQ